MQRFLITPVRDRAKLYWLASFPETGPRWPRGSTGRRQKKFVDREDAEIFLAGLKRKYEERWRWEYWSDTRVRNDVARALALISEVPGSSLEAAARVYLECVSAREGKVKTGFQEPEKVVLELEGRLLLGVSNLARRRGMSIEDLVSGVLWGFIEKESQERAGREYG